MRGGPAPSPRSILQKRKRGERTTSEPNNPSKLKMSAERTSADKTSKSTHRLPQVPVSVCRLDGEICVEIGDRKGTLARGKMSRHDGVLLHSEPPSRCLSCGGGGQLA